ncbi:hypothetical protein IFM89_022482 [Coptis chinensis]|uniref:Telomeric single stranded DNA binding POT1/Cdc13 domain-containing protein n=1 Tax=Coptis chinensis TaxID=261450 RepID=A0A835M190_9MAGN|nr:hypothetical protein IFM89_022482 [Coptis chinensis]
MRKKENYLYLSINDAISCINQKVNMVGVVVEYGLPEKSRGTDYFCTLKIMDESSQSYGLLVNVFTESLDKLPRVKSAGDIIRFSRIVIQSHNGKVNAHFNKKVSTFALYEGKCSKSFIPYQSSSSYFLKDLDMDFIASLRTWLFNFQLNSGTSEFYQPLSALREKKCFDLVCKVLRVCEVSKDAWMLFLWDGTDAPPLSCRTKLKDELKNPLPLQLEPTPLPRAVLCEFPSVGTILRVIVDKTSEKLALQLPCGWVKFLNIECEERSGLWFGVFKPSTKIRILSDEDSIVTCCLRRYEERLLTKWDRMPSSAFPWPSHITETDHEDVPFTTLTDVLTHSKVTSKFKCVVRVVAMCPWYADDFLSAKGNPLYRVRLTLEDPTARIHTLIYAEDGEIFFGGYPSLDVLTGMRNKLLGICAEDLDAPRNPPWVQLCLKSYCLDESDPWSSRKYRIFDTRLVA